MAYAARCYFSFRSPYAWLAMRHLDTLGWGIGSALEYLPYFEPPESIKARLAELGGSVLYRPMSRQHHFYILTDVKRTLRDSGLTLKWPIDEAPDWSIPHLAYLACPHDAARRHFARTLMEVRWLHGRCIWDWEEVHRLLYTLLGKVEADQTVRRARTEALLEQAVQVLYRAYLDDVFGVPYFIVGREKFWGNDRVEPFLSALTQGAGTAPTGANLSQEAQTPLLPPGSSPSQCLSTHERTAAYAQAFVGTHEITFSPGGGAWSLTLSPEEPVFKGHYPDNPILPGIFILDAIVQGVRAYFARDGRRAELARVKSMRFLAPFTPGDTMRVTLGIEEVDAPGEVQVSAEVMRESVRAASAKMLIRIQPETTA